MMVSPDFQPFFVASVGASAALIGLLFVSVSVAPERVFGNQAEGHKQAQALSAFTALVNIFFISIDALVPGVAIGIVVVIVTLPAVTQTLALLLFLPQWRAARMVPRGLFLFLASAAVYGYELYAGADLWRHPTSKGALIAIVYVMVGAYAIGLGRAWELLGAPRMGLIPSLLDLLERRWPPKPKA